MSTHATLLVIRDEHSALSAVLRSISLLLSEHRRRHTLPDFTVLRAMLFYIDEFPERIHHTKESQLLFPKVRTRSAEGAEVLDRLDADHERSAIRVRELEHELLGFEMMVDGPDGAARRAAFEQAMDTYIFEYLDHIRTEETVILPLAERVLTTADWLELDAAFMQNRDPLTRRDGDDAYRPLFKRILMTAAAPIGLGPAMEAMRQSYPQAGPPATYG